MAFAALDHRFRLTGAEDLVSEASRLFSSLPQLPDGDGDVEYDLQTWDDLDRAIGLINLEATRATPGLVHLHAAGLRSPDGHGVALLGPSGAGKSTLCTGLIQKRGWYYLSDETVSVDPDTMVIRPYPKPLTLKTGSHGLFPSLGQSQRPLWHLAVTEISPTPIPEMTTLSTVLVPRRGAGDVRLRQLAPAELVLAMAESSSYLVNLERPLAALASIANRVGAAELQYEDAADGVRIVEAACGS